MKYDKEYDGEKYNNDEDIEHAEVADGSQVPCSFKDYRTPQNKKIHLNKNSSSTHNECPREGMQLDY